MYKIKNHYRDWYHPHQSFIVRNPLFPVEQLFNWRAPDIADVEGSKEALRKSLKDFYRQPIAQEALYIGSPDLHEQLLLWLDNKIDKPDKREKMELSLVKYMIRMCSRCTPYGLFASCTSGNLTEVSSIKLADKFKIQRHGRIDMDYSGQALSHLLNNPEISDQLLFYPNSSLYPLGENYRYIEHRFTLESGRSYHLVQVARSIYLEQILEAANNGASPAQLAALITDEEISKEEAENFIHELILNQVLISDLEPNVTGEEYFLILLKKLKSLKHTERYVEQFNKVVKEFENIKNTAIDGNHQHEEDKNRYYKEIVRHLRELEIPVHLKTLIQVDSYRPADTCTLNKKVLDELLSGANLIQLLITSGAANDSFSDFKNAFMGRYESQWIPLVEVLDTESGIGYGKFATTGMEESPLIDKLPIGEGNANNQGQQNQVSDVERFKWQLYQEALLENKREVVIPDNIIEEFSKKELTSDGLAESAYVMTKIVASSAEEMEAGNYFYSIHCPAGPSGGNLLGRFCHLHPDIEKLARETLQNEETWNPDCIYAEIVHLPESRIGNILMRPVLRGYEIPYLCGSTLEKDFQIPVTDLLVGVKEGKVMLWSKKLNKRVLPRMTNAHNYSMTTLPIYHFLCDLQHQGVKQYGWSWGVLDSRPFLPRVSYGKCVLSKARWILTKEEVKSLEKKGDAEVFHLFSEVIKSRNLPQYILLTQSDNELLLDLQNIFCINLLLAEVNKMQQVTLTETFDLPGQCWISSEEGHYTNEFIFTFDKNKTAEMVTSPQVIAAKTETGTNEIKRYFPVGSEWLYAKLYCGTKTAEKILCESLKPLTEELLAEGIIDKYFFIRYHDNGNHIRIRFHHANNHEFWKEVIARLTGYMQPYMDRHELYNVQFETYQREMERYGVDTLEEAESIFYYQSKSILNFISLLDGDEGEQYRWQVALKAIDFILDDFKYTLEQKRDLIHMLHENFSSEFNISGPQQKKISERFSNNKKLIQQLMSATWEDDENLKQAIAVFKINEEDYHKNISSILNAPAVRQDVNVLNDYMGSYLHMFINRMFISNQRKVELVIYDYLLKVYETKMAMERNSKKGSKPKEVTSLK